ncbi:MAG: alpha-2-macroglobulin, partial [Planctomycetia bacterium]|nr:alpha-2-macroglobulin [Planctomycetia bacterium]
FGGGAPQGAPVDEAGKPILYRAPRTFEAAKSDGERWRWALVQVGEFAPDRVDEAQMEFANFLRAQFGVETMAWYGRFFGAGESDEPDKDESGTYALHTLTDDETIARLATGIKRFKLPDEFNFIKICQQVAENAKSPQGQQALATLADSFTNRRQYPRAADYWRQSIARYHIGNEQLQQIISNWARFEPATTQPSGRGAVVDFRFRNGKHVDFEAHEILVDKLLADLKAYLKSNPQQLDWQKVNIADLGYRLVQENQKQYVGRKVANWDLDLQPRKNHFDSRITVTTPLQKAGAYLVTARMAGGNESRIILWVADTAIVKKPLEGKTMYFVADATTGEPIPRANLEFFGYRQRWLGNGRNFNTDTLAFAEQTNADGQALTGIARQPQDYQWLIIARPGQDRLAYLGFTGVWDGRRYDAEYNETKVFTVTDRPVYRPGQPAKFKFWVRHAKYDQADTSDFAGRDFKVIIFNPKGEKIHEKSYKADAFGGIDGQIELTSDATLGVYQLTIENLGGGQFRVEEYKKPEYEVSVDAPKKPVMLGEKIAATLKARYYFGAPVTNAKVKYKITRSEYSETWYPWGRWDWLYGRGYWWFAYDCAWYPGWGEWGCKAPIRTWWFGWRQPQPPEIVAERETAIGPDGLIKIEIDTLPAKELHGNQDHQYTISAEVTDRSRRTIVGTGNVLVARKPFKIFSWVDRGYYRVGDTIEASFQAQTLDQKPVAGKGHLKLLKITYDAKRKPVEAVAREWDLATDAQGQAMQKIDASQAGQYRLSYKLTDAAGHPIEGGYLLTIVGEGMDSAGFRYNALELVPDKREYAPGESVKLRVNTDRVGSTVLLFARPANGVYLAPKTLRLDGKTVSEAIDIMQKDMPNIYIEALTVSNGRVHTEVREIVVPPEKRVIDVAIKPSAESYKPGQQAKVQLKLTDLKGAPLKNTSTVLAVYDKSLEYISGGSNVPEIKDFFWKWRRQHNPQTETSLDRVSGNLVFPRHPAMGDLGVFGNSVADEVREDGAVNINTATGGMADGRGLGGGGVTLGPRGGMAKASAMAAPAAPMAARGMANLAAADAVFSENQEQSRQDKAGAPPANLVQPTIRSAFADTAFWAAAIETDNDGLATVEFKMPENLTTWKIKAWGMSHGTKVGQAEAEVVTTKDLIVRLQAPRFFVEKDEVVLSANVHNYLKHAKSVHVKLESDGGVLKSLAPLEKTVEVPAGGETRVDWRVRVLAEGEAVVRMKALTDEDSDATELKLPAYVHGMLKTESYSGALRPEDKSGSVALRVPAERRADQSRLEVRYSPTLAAAMVDALPYIVEYPYGCTEQTLNRFLPTVITQKVLLGMGLDLKTIRDKRTNLNAQEIGDDKKRAEGWKRFDRNPVFDEDEVRAMVHAGVDRLTQMQLTDGGWGWFSGFGEQSWPHTTATVVHGLQIAQANDVALVPGVLERGVEWLKRYQAEQIHLLQNAPTKTHPWKEHADDLDALVYMVLVDAKLPNNTMKDYLYRDRTELAVYSKAMFGLALEKQKDQPKLEMILKNLRQFVVEDEENQTAYLKLPETNYWWCWYGSEIEADAYYLKLLARTEPKGRLASRLVKYLLNNRKHATYWNSTRDTAIAIEALADYLKASGEAKPDLTIEVWLDGQKKKEVHVTRENLFTFDNKFVLEGVAVETGQHKLELRKQGTGPLYFNAYLTNFTLEDFITKAGLEIKVNRKYFRLKEVDKTTKVAGSRGQAIDQKVEKYEREELANLAELTSGDLVEIELTIDSKNDYEYLLFEDMKAAGFEPVEVRSGYGGNDLGAYMELRDNRVALFVRALARGKHSISYRMRAEIPGKFSALPTRASAMYAPELKANSDEIKLRIVDAPEPAERKKD